MTFLKFERFSAKLRCCGKVFHIFRPSALKRFLKKITWFDLMVSRYRTSCLRAALFENDNSKILDINPRLADLVFRKFQYITT